MTQKLNTLDRLVRAAPRSGAGWAALALGFTGFGLMAVMETAGANLALRTSASPLDATHKIAFSLAFGFAFFFGAIVVAAKSADDRKYVRKGLAFARLVTVACFCVSSVNFASYVAFSRAEKAATETKASEQYKAIKADYADTRAFARDAAGDLTRAGAAQTALEEADKILAAAESPRAVVWFIAREDLKAGEVSVGFSDLLREPGREPAF